jgi:hypothetical protein
MNKELNAPLSKTADAFTAELERAADEILNHLSDDELDRLITGEDRTFLNQVTPSGELLVSSDAIHSEPACVYSWGNFVLTTTFCVSVSNSSDIYSVPSPDQAADRQDLALAA